MNTDFRLGWEEWLSLPQLGLPAIKAKVDTGATTSSLHATAVEVFGENRNPQVRFLVQPNPEHPSLEIVCSAPIVDRRNIISSNGEAELRYVIRTDICMGVETWPIEITLTNRSGMNYHMLLGRSAITESMIVNPNASFLQPQLDYSAYEKFPKRNRVRRPLHIALLTREPHNYSSNRLVEAAEARGHVIDIINTTRCYMRIGGLTPELHYDGAALPRYDAVIPRIGASVTNYGVAVLRQFEAMGTFCLNDGQGILASRDKLLAHQLLARSKIGMPITAFANSPKDTKDLIKLAGGSPVVVKLLSSTQGKGVVLAETRKAAESLVDAFRGLDASFLVQEFVAEAAGSDVRCFVIGNKVVGAMKRTAADGDFRSNLHRGGTAVPVKLTRAESEVARRSARLLGLNVAGVDLLQSERGPRVLEVNSSPGLEGMERSTGKDIAGKLMSFIESRARPLAPYADS